MKTARFILRIVGASLSLASTICLIVGFWDRIAALFSCDKEAES